MGLTHIRQRRDFKAAAETGRRFRASCCTIQLRDRADEAGLRLGLTASRQTGTAVERNRIRRRLRAAAERALASAAAQSIDMVVVARREALGEAFDVLSSNLVRALTEARFPRRTAGKPSSPSGQTGHPSR